MIGGGAWSWSDAQSSPVAGTSSAEPWEFSRYVSTENGARMISGQMQLGKNEELGWSSACIFVGVGTGSKNDAHDLGSANQLLLTGYVTAGEPLEIRLTQPDVDDWKGWATTLVGTGDSTTTYSLNIPTGKSFPDLENIYGMRFAAVSNHYSPVQFTFRSIVARNQGHFPHTDFKLPKSGGEIFLFDSAGTLRDSIAYPNVPTGKSYALTTVGWGLANPSPLGVESFAYAGQAVNRFSLPHSDSIKSRLTFFFPAIPRGPFAASLAERPRRSRVPYAPRRLPFLRQRFSASPLSVTDSFRAKRQPEPMFSKTSQALRRPLSRRIPVRFSVRIPESTKKVQTRMPPNRIMAPTTGSTRRYPPKSLSLNREARRLRSKALPAMKSLETTAARTKRNPLRSSFERSSAIPG